MSARHFLMPPRRSDLDIKRSAERLTSEYVRRVGTDLAALGMGFDVAYEHVIYPDYGIELEEDADLGSDEFGEKILGLFDPLTNRAYVDACLHPREGDPRRAFTCWHEVAGHGILHGPWLRREIERLGSTMAIPVTELSISRETTNVLECQANLFAAHAAAPTRLVEYAITSVSAF